MSPRLRIGIEGQKRTLVAYTDSGPDVWVYLDETWTPEEWAEKANMVMDRAEEMESKENK